MTEYRYDFQMGAKPEREAFEERLRLAVSGPIVGRANGPAFDQLDDLASLIESGEGKLMVAKERQDGPTSAVKQPMRAAPKPVAPVEPPSADAFEVAPDWTQQPMPETPAASPEPVFDLRAEINRQLGISSLERNQAMEPVGGPVDAPLLDAPVVDAAASAFTQTADLPLIHDIMAAAENAAKANSDKAGEANPSFEPSPEVEPSVKNAIFDTSALQAALEQSGTAPEALPIEPSFQADHHADAQPIPNKPHHDPVLEPKPDDAYSDPAAEWFQDAAAEERAAAAAPVARGDLPATSDDLHDDRSLEQALDADLAMGLETALQQEVELALRQEALEDLAQEFEKFDSPSEELSALAHGAAAPTAPQIDAPELAAADLSTPAADAIQPPAHEFERELARMMNVPMTEAELAQSVAATQVMPAPDVPTAPAVPAAIEPVAPVMDYSDPAAGFHEPTQFDPLTADQAPPSSGSLDPAPLDPPALNAMDRVLDGASALGVAATGPTHGHDFDAAFSQSFEQALAADMAAQSSEAPGPNPELSPAPMPEPAAYQPSYGQQLQPAPQLAPAAPDIAAVEPNPAFVAPVAKKGGKRVAAIIAAIAVLGGATAFGYAYLGAGDEDVPTLVASTDKVKERPKKAGGKVVPNQDQSVFRSVDAAAKPAPVQETLKDDSEKPVDIARTAPRVVPSTTGSATNTNGGISGTTVPSTMPTTNRTANPATSPTTNQGATANSSARIVPTNSRPLVQPRRVRTVTVRPDGTIVTSTPKAAAGPTGITIPEANLAPLSNINPGLALAPNDAPAAPAAASRSNTAGGVQYRLPTASLPTTALATSQTQPSAPVTRPVTAAPAPKATPPKATPASDSAAANSGIATGPKPPFAVQIASQRTVDAANRSYRTLSRRYASVLGGKGKDIRPIEIDGRGTFYRVRIPAQTRAEANALCRRLKSAGGDCFVTR